ncbi:glucosamine-6-phosphate deaminase [Chitinophaga caeni]|uniref:Glucosamine-6-phosphate deaminase n=1 Tax=Chitinophaga caeni TaxID=2029983 RepID=A0A291QZ85_9BACT|nr:glucosamine-6-phosphate deaminase [Chitinophaga caeni]ATL49258.1 glucosamine-6-phosphate deaminase [Chitinophaga caeni]
MEKVFHVDLLQVKVYNDRTSMGENAAAEAICILKDLLSRKSELNIVFAAAPSQNEFLAHLKQAEGVDWTRVNAFHMDEYTGLPVSAPQSFGNFLKARIFEELPFREIFYIRGNDGDAECERYTKILEQHPPDIVFMGIGENAHLAFNDPPVANFDDPLKVKLVPLDLACRQQQVNDGCFISLEEVPREAITLTIPVLMSAPHIFCMVPGSRKAAAVFNSLTQAIQTYYPASILRMHPGATLYLDKQSFGMMSTQNI